MTMIKEFPKVQPGQGSSSAEIVPLGIGLKGRVWEDMRGTTPPLPNVINLGTLGDRRLRVVIPLKVHIEKIDDRYTAEAQEINEFGCGATYSDAVSDLQRTIRELFITLKNEQNRLGPDLQHTWSILQERIKLVKA